MKTYACPGCGDRVQTDCEIDCRACNRAMRVLDGIISGGGVKAIWRDGKEVWSGTAMEAVELLAKYLQPSCTIDAKRAQLAIDTIDGYGKFTPAMDGYAGIVVLRDYIKRTSSVVSSEQAAEADRIVRRLADTTLHPMASDECWVSRDMAIAYTQKYPKT